MLHWKLLVFAFDCNYVLRTATITEILALYLKYLQRTTCVTEILLYIGNAEKEIWKEFLPIMHSIGKMLLWYTHFGIIFHAIIAYNTLDIFNIKILAIAQRIQ